MIAGVARFLEGEPRILVESRVQAQKGALARGNVSSSVLGLLLLASARAGSVTAARLLHRQFGVCAEEVTEALSARPRKVAPDGPLLAVPRLRRTRESPEGLGLAWDAETLISFFFV